MFLGGYFGVFLGGYFGVFLGGYFGANLGRYFIMYLGGYFCGYLESTPASLSVYLPNDPPANLIEDERRRYFSFSRSIPKLYHGLF